ncbi:forkhead-associated domain-containing protein 1 [Megalops cyprinoides]|uniref:forkhead-associated domain-containing protein 1 n=1 Tax=Megalops cyprinoides TaxID=118141 RepID=UPI001865608E|nr:forkhead-associated domain-containing protein 1 [Megalops cyprinoides]
MRGYLKTLGWVFKLQPKTTTVGKHEDSDLCLQNGGVEEHHALIEHSEADRCFVLHDLNSTHGTFVNGCRIHNAAVRLAPGDELHFGYGGPAYQLAVDTASPRVAWQTPLQLIEDSSPVSAPPNMPSQLPLLPGQPSTSMAWIQGGPTAPRPPSKARPVSAGAKRAGLGHSTEPEVPSVRPGSGSGNSGAARSHRSTVTSQNAQTLQHLLQEKEERILRLGDEVSRLAVFEGESWRKDGVIAGLRDEVSALRHQVALNRVDPEISSKLRSLERDVGEKKEQIQQLKEQMVELQNGSSEVFKHSLAERDLKIANLRTQVEKLKKDSSMSSGLATSLQRDLSAREKQALKLAAEVDKLRQDIRHKDAQLGALSAKFSRTRENKSHQEELQARENDIIALRKRAEKLEQTLTERQTELQRQGAERDSLKSRLGEERQLERLRSRIIQATYSAPGVSPPQDTVSDQEVIDQMTEIIEEKEALGTRLGELEEQKKEVVEEREALRARVQELEEQLKEGSADQDRAAEEAGRLRTMLEECTTRLQEARSAPALQSEISTLQGQSVPPSLTWVQSAALSMLGGQLARLQEVAQALQDAGIDMSDFAEGAPGGIRALWNQSQEREVELRALQAKLQEVEGGQDALVQSKEAKIKELQDQLSAMREELEQQRQQGVEARGQEEELQLQLEEARRELDLVRGAEAALREETQAKEVQWQARVEEAEQKGAEMERGRYRVQEAEYREQVRQHAHTIVDLDQRLARVTQHMREGEEEKMEKKLEGSTPEPGPIPPQPIRDPEVVALEENVTLLRAELAKAQEEVVAQGDVIAALSRDLAVANARMSDMTGELSEQQKVELEQHRALLVNQKVELSMLTQKLAQMSQLVDQKGEELQRVREELRQCQEELQRRVQAEKEREEQADHSPALIQTPASTQGEAALAAAAADLADQGSKCRGHRHEEVIQRQQEALAELRARVKALEQTAPMMSSPELCIQQVALMRRELCELRAQKAIAQRGTINSMSGPLLCGSLAEDTLEHTARLDLSDALDLSERTYLDLARALCEALELGEGQLSGCASLKHLPQDEREKLASHRQRDQGLLQARLGLLQSQARRREQLLQEYQKDMCTLRESQAAGQQLQAKLDSLRAELQTECQESSLLREALRRTQARLEQEIGLNRAVKERKALSAERPEKRSTRTPSHSCVQDEIRDKAAAKKASLQEKLRRREYEIEVLKQQLRRKDQELCSATSRPAGILQAPVASEAS